MLSGRRIDMLFKASLEVLATNGCPQLRAISSLLWRLVEGFWLCQIWVHIMQTSPSGSRETSRQARLHYELEDTTTFDLVQDEER